MTRIEIDADRIATATVGLFFAIGLAVGSGNPVQRGSIATGFIMLGVIVALAGVGTYRVYEWRQGGSQ